LLHHFELRGIKKWESVVFFGEVKRKKGKREEKKKGDKK